MRTTCRCTTRGPCREDAGGVLPDGLRHLVHARDDRRAHAQERAADLHVRRAPAERREPVARGVLSPARRPDRAGAGVLLDGGRGGRGGGRTRDHRSDIPTQAERGRGRRMGAPRVSTQNGALWLIPTLPLATAGINLFWG